MHSGSCYNPRNVSIFIATHCAVMLLQFTHTHLQKQPQITLGLCTHTAVVNSQTGGATHDANTRSCGVLAWLRFGPRIVQQGVTVQATATHSQTRNYDRQSQKRNRKLLTRKCINLQSNELQMTTKCTPKTSLLGLWTLILQQQVQVLVREQVHGASWCTVHGAWGMVHGWCMMVHGAWCIVQVQV